MVGWEMRFRLPHIAAEIGSLLANVQRSPWPEAIAATMPQTSLLADALAEITKRGSGMQVAGAELLISTELYCDIGRVLSGMPGIGRRESQGLRTDFGAMHVSRSSWP